MLILHTVSFEVVRPFLILWFIVCIFKLLLIFIMSCISQAHHDVLISFSNAFMEIAGIVLM